jgi:hypothetical protein
VGHGVAKAMKILVVLLNLFRVSGYDETYYWAERAQKLFFSGASVEEQQQKHHKSLKPTRHPVWRQKSQSFSALF